MSIITILGYLTLGIVTGWLSRILYGDRGVKLIPSIAFGVFGALTGAAITHLNGLAGAGFFAVMAAIGILFIVNTFRQDDPLFEEAAV